MLKGACSAFLSKSLTAMPVPLKHSRTLLSGKADSLYKFQKLLPRLPVPPLADTARRYLESIEPYLTSKQLSAAQESVADFVKPGGVGDQLQSRLCRFAEGQDNWLGEWWDDHAYMAYRDPVVPFVSYFFAHKDLNNAIGKNQLLKATLLAYYSIGFAASVTSQTLEPAVVKGTPLCMNAFGNMFNNCRVPGPNVDKTVFHDPQQARFFVVIFENKFFKVSSESSHGSRLSKGEIYHQLNAIVTSGLQPEEAVGALTTLNRDEYSEAFEHLMRSPLNRASFDDIAASSFVLCLDSLLPVTVEEKSRYSWYGDGRNRFFDKPLQFFVAKNGHSGFLGEHSRMDATPTVQLNNSVLSLVFAEDPLALIAEIETTPACASKSHPVQLKFILDNVSRSHIAKAQEKFATTISTLNHRVFQFFGYGKSLIKKFKVSPDAYVQMMMQLAYFKLTGTVRPTYESASTRKFLKGRTETCRVVSTLSKKFVETWTDPFASVDAKVESFQQACAAHVSYLDAAASGHGVDRHILGLKHMLRPGENVPPFFRDPITSFSSTWYLSTSQVPSEYFQNWGWSHVIEPGFGLAYLINNESLSVNICAKNGSQVRSDHFKHYLTESAHEMGQVLGQALLPSKPKL